MGVWYFDQPHLIFDVGKKYLSVVPPISDATFKNFTSFKSGTGKLRDGGSDSGSPCFIPLRCNAEVLATLKIYISFNKTETNDGLDSSS
jgi:hypothetical protein